MNGRNPHHEALEAALVTAQNELSEWIDDLESNDRDASTLDEVQMLLEQAGNALAAACPDERPDDPTYAPWHP